MSASWKQRPRRGLATLAACALIALAGLNRAGASSQGATPPGSAAISARVSIEPRSAQVGEPLRARIELALPRGCELQPPELGAWLGAQAALLGPARASALPQPASAGAPEHVLHALEFEFTALEPGELALPALALRWSSAPGAGAQSAGALELPAGALSIASALELDEDAPRALRSASIEARELPWWRTKVAAGAISAAVATIVGLLVVAGGHAWVRRKARRARVAPPSALEQLAALQSSSASARWSAEQALATSQELARILREGIDAQRGRAHAGASDEEWLALQTEAERERLRALFARLASARFGGEAPSEWALRELSAEVRALLEGARGGGALELKEARA